MDTKHNAAHRAHQHIWRAAADLRAGRRTAAATALRTAADVLRDARRDPGYVNVATQFLRLCPRAPEVWRGLAYTHLRDGSIADAGLATAAWLQLMPHDPDAQECRAEWIGRTGRRSEAARSLVKLSFAELDQHHVGRARQLLERARSWCADLDEVVVLDEELRSVRCAPNEEPVDALLPQPLRSTTTEPTMDGGRAKVRSGRASSDAHPAARLG